MKKKYAAEIRAGILVAKLHIDFAERFGFLPPVSDPPTDLIAAAYERTITRYVLRAFKEVSDMVVAAAAEKTGNAIPPEVVAAKDQLDAVIREGLGHKHRDELEGLL